MTAKDSKRSIFIDALSHVRNLFMHEKLSSDSHDVIGKAHLLGNLASSHTFIQVAKVAGR